MATDGFEGFHVETRPEFTSYAEAILDVLAADPGRPALTTADGVRITAGELHNTTCRLAGELTDRGAAHPYVTRGPA